MQKTETYIDGVEAAQRLGCSRRTAVRAARTAGVGIYVKDKLVAIPLSSLPRIRAVVHATPGNPSWIAAGKNRAG